MPVPVSPAPWAGSLLWLLALTAIAFLVAWLPGNRTPVGRTAYVGVLTAVTALLSAGYLAWLDIGVLDVLTTHWGWGLLAAPVAGAFLVLGMRRLPGSPLRPSARTLLWEGVVYGVAEGMLLSVLPVLMTWQLVHALDWPGFAAWTLPILASVVVVVVHHLGYWEYRNRLLVPISVGCGLLSVGYLVTASPVAATLGHVLGHGSGLKHGVELPPHPHPAGGLPASLARDGLRTDLEAVRHRP